MSSDYLRQEVAEILDDFRKLSNRLEALLPKLGNMNLDGDMNDGVGIFALLTIPDHLRKSVLILSALDEATAAEVAMKTGRTRVAESMYLNQLNRMGHVAKIRRGKTVYFALRATSQ